jgi:hypothetical protein
MQALQYSCSQITHSTAMLLSISFVHAALPQMCSSSSPAKLCFLGE